MFLGIPRYHLMILKYVLDSRHVYYITNTIYIIISLRVFYDWFLVLDEHLVFERYSTHIDNHFIKISQ